jgi:glycosyltransferase involved in cell wall biosynthesis
MRIACLIPDRNDRPEFLKNCLRMLKNQTVQPDIIEVVNDESPFLPTEKDITWRYRTGYDRLRNRGIDCILFVENDDYYAPDYIETITSAWEADGRPELFGPNYTVYYNVNIRSYVKLTHLRRSTMASTLIKADLNFSWPVDNEPYTDSHLWQRTKLVKRVFNPIKTIFVGIKHGMGLVGGEFHTTKYDYYEKHGNTDADARVLSQLMDVESFKFYSSLLK